MLRTQPDPSSRQAPHGPAGAATHSVAVAALLLVAACHAQAQDIEDLQFNTSNYLAGASIDSSNATVGDFGSGIVFENVAIGDTRPPQWQLNTGPYGSFTELAGYVTRTQTSSEYTVVPELGAAVVSSQDIPLNTTNALNVGATYVDLFWLSDFNGNRLDKGLGYRWTPDPATTLEYPTTAKASNNVNEMSLVFTPSNPNALPIVIETTFGPGSSPLEFNINFPFDFGFNPDSLYKMTLHFFVGSQVYTDNKTSGDPDPTMTVNIRPPGMVESVPFGTLQVTNQIRDAEIYHFEIPPGPQIPEPASAVLLGLGGIALLRRRRSHTVS